MYRSVHVLYHSYCRKFQDTQIFQTYTEDERMVLCIPKDLSPMTTIHSWFFLQLNQVVVMKAPGNSLFRVAKEPKVSLDN